MGRKFEMGWIEFHGGSDAPVKLHKKVRILRTFVSVVGLDLVMNE